MTSRFARGVPAGIQCAKAATWIRRSTLLRTLVVKEGIPVDLDLTIELAANGGLDLSRTVRNLRASRGARRY